MKRKFEKHYGPNRSEAEGGPPSVHPQETSQQSSTAFSYRAFLVSGMHKDVDHAVAVYRAIDNRDDTTRTGTLQACRSAAWFVRHRVSGEIRLFSSRCGLRWCPLCIKTKRFVMQESLKPWVKKAKGPKFITLTLKHSKADLSHQIDSLYKFCQTLRRRPFWKKRIKGGVWFFQIKKSKNDGLWHPHLHLIVEGAYLPQKKLSSAWSEITHGSSIVDIRAVKNPKKAVEYVARYATAPCRLADLELEDSIEVFDALHGRRICGTFGTGREVVLAPKKCPDSDSWEFMAGFSAVMFNRHKDDWHAEIYDAFIKERSCYSQPPPWDQDGKNLLNEIDDMPVTYRQLVFEFSNWETK